MILLVTLLYHTKIKFIQGRHMNNLPVVLVNTWLLIAADKREENREARKVAIKNIFTAFGNIDVAQLYVEKHTKKTAESLLKEG